LLRGLDLNSPLLPIIKRDPVVAPPEILGETVLHLMKANGFNAIPIIDAHRQVLGLHLLKELLAPGKRPNQMVLMAGGQGTRLRPHTENCPKPMLLVRGKPMLEHILERAKFDGFERFVVTTHFHGEVIEEYFGDGRRWQVTIDYIREGEPTGTAGAIARLSPRPDTPFLVSNGDVLTDIRYGEVLDFHTRHRAAATMAVRLYEWQHPFGVVRTNGVDIVGFEEKPIARSHINAGIYVLEPEALDCLSIGDFCDMPTLFARLQERGARTIVYPMHEPWLDVGRADDLSRAQPPTPPHSADGTI
jgi:NDP-sugar pyrophosphorylase family protein